MSKNNRARKRLRVYMAGPLFSVAERDYNLRLANALRNRLPQLVFVLPQKRASALLPNLAAVVADCFAQVRKADVILACLDGPDADSGTCVEIGYAAALKKPVFGYRTDFRGSEAKGVNAMLRYGCTEYVRIPSNKFPFRSLVATLASKLRLICTRRSISGR